MKTRLALVVGLSAVLALGGCKKKKPTADGGTDTTSGDDTTASAPLKKNTQVVDLLKKLQDGCTVSVETASVYSCKAKEDTALYDFIRAQRPKDLFETYAAVITTGDEKQKAVAIAQANNTFFSLDKDLKKANATKDVANAFLDALAKDDRNAARLAGITANLSFLAGTKDRLIKVTDTLANTPARNNAYREFMQFGRLDALPKLKEVAKDKDFAVSALAAPRSMSDWTDAEKNAICPWAKGYIGDSSLNVAAEAGRDLVSCKGEYIDVVLDEGEKRLKAKQFDNPFSDVFREVCFDLFGKASSTPAREAQCKRNFAFLEKVVNDETVKSDVRAWSLWNIYYQRKDKETLTLMRKYQNHKNPEIAKRAKEAITSLTTNYKLK